MSLKCELLKQEIGATVSLERSRIADRDTALQIMELLEKHTVLVFPQIGLTDAEQLALTDTLGDRLNITARVPGRADADALYTVTLDKNRNPEPEYVLGTFFWHMDGLTIDLPPAKASLLTARKLAPTGGQTEFASTYAAYRALPSEEKAALEGLRVMHTVIASLREIVEPDAVDPARRSLRHEHPLVWTRADGRKSLVIGSTADYVIGKSKAESRALFARLIEWAAQPAFTYRHHWRTGDLVIWDNTAALHRVIPYAEDSGRLMRRTAIAGAEAVR